MTILKNSQLAATSAGTNANPKLEASQLAVVAAVSNPAAAALKASQLCVVTVIANNKQFKPLDTVISLGCWTPCANLAFGGR